MKDFDLVFKALADPTRREVRRMLSGGELSDTFESGPTLDVAPLRGAEGGRARPDPFLVSRPLCVSA